MIPLYTRKLLLAGIIGLMLSLVTDAIAYGYIDDAYIADTAASDSYYDTARVVEVEPDYEIVEELTPVKECWIESSNPGYSTSGRSIIGTLVGGVLGGVIGHQFGRGRGKPAATIIGSLTGATLGHSVSRYDNGSYNTEERCQVVQQRVNQQYITGYRVKYRYKGKTFETRTKEHPGETIRLQVNVAPR